MSEFAGTLKERITIERPVGERTPTGVQQTAWETVCRCLAAIVLEGAGAESEGQALSAMPRLASRVPSIALPRCTRTPSVDGLQPSCSDISSRERPPK